MHKKLYNMMIYASNVKKVLDHTLRYSERASAACLFMSSIDDHKVNQPH